MPFFFVTSGARLDLSALSWWPGVWVVVVLAVALLAVRGVPAVLLPLAQGRLSTATATAMTAAGLIGVCLFPVAGVALLGRGDTLGRRTPTGRDGSRPGSAGSKVPTPGVGRP